MRRAAGSCRKRRNCLQTGELTAFNCDGLLSHHFLRSPVINQVSLTLYGRVGSRQDSPKWKHKPPSLLPL